MMIRNTTLLIVFALFILTNCAMCQAVVEWTEEELALQAKYIEANKQKLLGNVQEALDLYDKILSKKNDLHPAWYEKARMHHASQNDQEAIAAIDKAIKYDPQNQWYVLFKSDVYERSNQLTLAAEVLEEFIKKEIATKSLKEELAYILLRSQQYEQAISIFDLLEKEYGINIDYSKQKYSLYTKLGNEEMALFELEKLAQKFPSNIEALHLLAVNYSKQNKEVEAKKIYGQILLLDPDDTRASIAMAQTYRENGHASSFVKSIQSIIANPNLDIDLKIQELVPQLEKLIDNYTLELSEELIKSGSLLQKTHPNNPKATALRADIYFHSGKFGLARLKYEETLKYAQNIYSVWEQYLYTLYILNDFNALFENTKSALDLFPNKARLYFFDGFGEAVNGNLSQSKKTLKHGLIIGKNHPSVFKDISLLLAAQELKNANTPLCEELINEQIIKYQQDPDGVYMSFIEYAFLLSNNNVILTNYYHKIENKDSSYANYTGAISFLLTNNLEKAALLINKYLDQSPIRFPRAIDLYLSILESSTEKDKIKYEAFKTLLDDMGYTRFELTSQP